MNSRADYSLYLVTDRTLMSTKTLEEAVKQAITGGCTMIQLREKEASSLDFFEIARRIKKITDYYQVKLIINDRVDIALAIDADGVHIGQRDLPAKIVRTLIGPDKILGISASNVTDALQAVKDGADYLGVGAMYSTNTKTDAVLVTLPELKRIREAVTLPIVIIGGLNKDTIAPFIGLGINGIAVVSAVISSQDIYGSAKELKKLFFNCN